MLCARSPTAGASIFVLLVRTATGFASCDPTPARTARACPSWPGARDGGKRALMGQAAARLADVMIVTDDTPRGEDPAVIRAAILAACPDAMEIGDRARAIETALNTLGGGDVLVVAGKGHEQGQI